MSIERFIPVDSLITMFTISEFQVLLTQRMRTIELCTMNIFVSFWELQDCIVTDMIRWHHPRMAIYNVAAFKVKWCWHCAFFDFFRVRMVLDKKGFGNRLISMFTIFEFHSPLLTGRMRTMEIFTINN